jgi:hypothetical protein
MSISENLFLGRELRRPGFLGNVLRMLGQEEDAPGKHRPHAGAEGRHPLDDAAGGNAVRRAAPVRRRWGARRPSRSTS